eukprot:TRINITY_DN927_c0_g1_i1.p1 TRINITY_DN927_c0_g1~~TRINITY_DN927_c0_g1_i1.p1  ORF type:complete len:422 (-),score=80.97 TRINITY_DN927_c0_g1_i1:36-1301(-)
MESLPSVLVCGTGEYTTGFVHEGGSTSDKKVGVVGLVLFDLRRRKLVDKILFAGTNGKKFPQIREYLKNGIEKTYKDMDTSFLSFPADDVDRDPKAYLKAMDTLKKGDLVLIFTPDDIHYEIIKAAVEKGFHVLVTKPAVQSLEHHLELLKLAKTNNVLVTTEVHKRWDPIYADAWTRIQNFGDFSYFYSFMSQPKKQLITFKQWAGKSSDISFYLNSHHVDFHVWALKNRAIPVRVVASASTGVAINPPYSINTEDSITLLVNWVNVETKSSGTAIYTSSWTASPSDVHSQQRFFFMGHKGEITVDQAHRGYTVATDADGFASVNPLFMKYTPSANGYFDGQSGYGYKSIEEFVVAATKLRNGSVKDSQYFDAELATLSTTSRTTAILEGGLLSLRNGGKAVTIKYGEGGIDPIGFEVSV